MENESCESGRVNNVCPELPEVRCSDINRNHPDHLCCYQPNEQICRRNCCYESENGSERLIKLHNVNLKYHAGGASAWYFLCYIISSQMEQTPVLRSCVVSGILAATSYRQNGTLWRNDQQNYIQSVLQSH